MSTMRHPILLACLLGISCLLHVSTVSAASCRGSGPRPAWVDSPESIAEGYFYAAGVSADAREPLAERIASARQNALKALSGMIEVSVRDALILEQSSVRRWGSEFTDSKVSAVTQTSTAASLRNVEVVATWEDAATCDLWLRARIAQRDVDNGRRDALARMQFDAMRAQLALAQDATQRAAARADALAGAEELLARIELARVPQAAAPEHYRASLDQLRAALQAEQSAQGDLQTADRLLGEAALQSDRTVRAERLMQAAATYRGLLSRFPGGLSGVFASGDLLFRLGSLEEARGDQCSAKDYYRQAQQAPQLEGRAATAADKAQALVCTPAEMTQARWRRFFEGRTVALQCAYRVAGKVVAWHKACDGLDAQLRALGARVERAPALEGAQVEQLAEQGVPDGLVRDERLVLLLVADGRVATRAAAQPGAANEYQFDGRMAVVLLDGTQQVFADRFSGMTGWNPVSQQMVMEVLALNMVKRWQKMFGKFLGDA